MGSSSDIDLSLANIWQCYKLFRQGKRESADIVLFEYYLEKNLLLLTRSLQSGSYQHGSYRYFEVHDNKRRRVAVASVVDRVVHRMLYEYLLPIWDKHFIYDCWSCRPGKGLHACAKRTQELLYKYKNGWLWRADITKFFDNVDHIILKKLIGQKSCGENAKKLLEKTIASYSHNSKTGRPIGLPIGNLTSQILANVYLNELDRFVLHQLKPLSYARYGDDFVLWGKNKQSAQNYCETAREFIARDLRLSLHKTNNVVQPVNKQLHFLGLEFWPSGRRPDKRMRSRLINNLDYKNVSSYRAILLHHGTSKDINNLDWQILNKFRP